MQSRKVLTLLIIHQGNKLLLGMKKRGFGAGRYNGFGGKIEKDETILEGAIRETVEEAGVRPTDAKQLGIIDFEFKGDPVLLEVHLFKATTFTGEVQ
jgi:8-oxo-dGTP pyrophosphatase MutT (NUDIX family)